MGSALKSCEVGKALYTKAVFYVSFTQLKCVKVIRSFISKKCLVWVLHIHNVVNLTIQSFIYKKRLVCIPHTGQMCGLKIKFNFIF
jgi:hypothetical protein